MANHAEPLTSFAAIEYGRVGDIPLELDLLGPYPLPLYRTAGAGRSRFPRRFRTFRRPFAGYGPTATATRSTRLVSGLSEIPPAATSPRSPH